MGRGVLGKCSSCNGTGRIEKTEETQDHGADPHPILEETYDFSEDQIRSRVEKGKIGNYALGFSATHKDTNTEVFHPTFVGRSDSDLQEELLTRLAKKKPWYDRFKFSYATTVREAFERECREFHLTVGGIDNEAHPQRPNGTDFPCPIPNCKALES